MAWVRWLAAAAAAWALAGVAPANAANFTYEDPQCADFTVTGTGPSYTLTCTLIATPACQLQAYPANPTAGTQVSLVASCTGGAFGWIFTKGTSLASQAQICGTSSATCTDSVPTAGTTLVYTVLGGNAVGRGPVAAITVTWQ
jgi:dissimilatory sulfite reductase (desulfoviridin) alpha/beta subunit